METDHAAPSGVAEDEEVAPVIPSEGVLAKVKWKAIRASTYIVGVLIAIGLVIVGLKRSLTSMRCF